MFFARGKKRLGFEFKRSPSPGFTASMRTALADLRLSRLFVVHSGTKGYPLGERAEAVALKDLAKVI
jgi:3-oxoacyl-(acyl-carrier-protein) synthase